jgi:hypothetical protein
MLGPIPQNFAIGLRKPLDKAKTTMDGQDPDVVYSLKGKPSGCTKEDAFMISGRLLCGVALLTVVSGFHRQSTSVQPIPISGRHDSIGMSPHTTAAQTSADV